MLGFFVCFVVSSFCSGFTAADGVRGLTLRTPLQEHDKVDVMLEQWYYQTSFFFFFFFYCFFKGSR